MRGGQPGPRGQEDSSEGVGGADLVSKAGSDLDSTWQEKGSLTPDDCYKQQSALRIWGKR